MPCFVTCLWAWSYRVYSWRMGFHHVLICSMQISPVSVDMYEHVKKKKMIIKLIPFHWQLSVGNYNLEVSLFLSALLHTPFPSSKALFCQSKGSSAQGLEFSLPSSENRTGVWKISYWELWNDKWELDSISARTVLPSGYVCAQRGGNVQTLLKWHQWWSQCVRTAHALAMVLVGVRQSKQPSQEFTIPLLQNTA